MDFRKSKSSSKIYTPHTLSSALDEVLSLTRPLPAMLVPLHDALHSVLAEPITSPLPLPTFRTAKTDGYAIRVGSEAVDELDREVLNTRVEAGVDTSQLGLTVEGNEAVWISQGCMVPVGANTVVGDGGYKEIKTLANASDDADSITLRKLPAEGENIAQIGDDLEEGKTVLERGHVLDHFSIGVLASMGIFLVRVHLQPAVGILSVGDAVVDTGSPLTGRGKIRDFTRSSLQAMFSNLKVAVTDYGIVPCKSYLVEDKIKEAARKCDIVVVVNYEVHEKSGRADTVKETLEEIGKVKIGKVSMKNAEGTTVFSCLPSRGPSGVKFAPRPSIRENGHSPRVVFTVPGSHVSASQAVTRMLVEPCVRRMKGREANDCRPLVVRAEIEGGWNGGADLEIEPCRVGVEGGKIVGKCGGVSNTLLPWIDANGILLKESGGGGREGSVVLVDTGKETGLGVIGETWVGGRNEARGASVLSAVVSRSSVSSYAGSTRSSVPSYTEPVPANLSPPSVPVKPTKPVPPKAPIRVPSVVPEVEVAAVETVKVVPPPLPPRKSETAANGDSSAIANGKPNPNPGLQRSGSKITKEQLLSDEEFESIFGMGKDAFACLPSWRQLNMRKTKGYF